MNSLRKKVGNFIAGSDTSQTGQAEQQGPYDAKGKHTPLPVDQYLFLGMKYDIHFVTVDVTTFGRTTLGLVTGQTTVASDVTSKYNKLGEPYQQGFILETFKATPGVGKIGWNANETPYQGIFSRPLGVPVYHSWKLLVVKSSIQTVERAGLLEQLSGRGNDVANQSGIISVISQYCKQGGRLVCVELSGQKQSQGVLGSIGGKSEIFGCDVFFNMPLHPNPALFTYQLVNVPVQVMYLGPGKLVKVTCDWMAHFTQHLHQGWKLIDIFWDQGKRSHGDFSLSGEHNSVWFFEKESAKLKDPFPTYQGTIIEYQHTVKRRAMQSQPQGANPSAMPQGMPNYFGPPPAPYAPAPGAQYPMAGQAAGYYPPQGQAAAPPPGAYPNYAPPPYTTGPEPSAPPLPEKQ